MEFHILPISVAMMVIPIVLLLGARRQQMAILTRLHKRRRSEETMANELIQSLVGKQCNISTGPFGEAFKKVEVLDVADKWIRVQDGERERLINSDYITSIRIAKEK